MKVTEQQFFDYMACPALFEMKYVKRIPMEETISQPKLLTTVAKFFFLNLLNGKICSSSDVRRKWDSICVANEEIMDKNNVMKGIGLIMQMLNWAQREQPVVLDIDTLYTIQVGDTEMTGNLGAVIAAPNNKYELLVMNFSNSVPDQVMCDMKLKYTLEAYAFYKVHNKFIDGIRIHNVKHDKSTFSYRTDGDFKRLETTIDNVGKSIAQGLYYVREGMCSTCPAKGYCRHWFC